MFKVLTLITIFASHFWCAKSHAHLLNCIYLFKGPSPFSFLVAQEPKSDGSLTLHYSRNASTTRTVSVGLARTNIDLDSTKIGTVESQGKIYNLENAGFRVLQMDQLLLQETVANLQIPNNEDVTVEIKSEGHRQAIYNELAKRRWRVHTKVLETYKKRKPYLTDADLKTLIGTNILSDNSDVITLSVGEDLKATIQISYAGDHNFRVLDIFNENDQNKGILPFVFRLSREARKRILTSLNLRFSNRSLAEFTRYALLAEIPAKAKKALLDTAIATAYKNGVDVIIANTDAFTRRLFKRQFGFQDFASYTDSSGTEEFILYLEVKSSANLPQ